ncbi:MAG: acyl-CoA dehydrogenase family protein, partial [Proteobacteria bacterium]|nr:acyl-CoA dehydrogenase family protein [Pseudomonadota bacterium]
MFEFESEEQTEIRSSVRKLALKAIPAFQSEQFYGTVPRSLFEALAELGLAGLSVPEALGGIQASAVTSSIVMEELAAVDLGPAI